MKTELGLSAPVLQDRELGGSTVTNAFRWECPKALSEPALYELKVTEVAKSARYDRRGNGIAGAIGKTCHNTTRC
jgi:hypothetical protein